MTWTAPMTAVAGSTFTAAQFNQHVRDNLNETAPAKATAASQIFVSTGPNAIATRVPSTATVAAQQGTTSTTYTNLATSGPAVTVTTGTIAIVLFASGMSTSATDTAAWASVEVTGASTVAASDTWSVQMDGITLGNFIRYGMAHVFTGLNPGSNTFRMRYRAGGSSTANFRDRTIGVIPL